MVVIEERQSGFNNHADCAVVASTTEPSTNEFAEEYSTPQLTACGGTGRFRSPVSVNLSARLADDRHDLKRSHRKQSLPGKFSRHRPNHRLLAAPQILGWDSARPGRDEVPTYGLRLRCVRLVELPPSLFDGHFWTDL